MTSDVKKDHFTTMVPQVEFFRSSFLGEVKTPKRHFQINWPLGKKVKHDRTHHHEYVHFFKRWKMILHAQMKMSSLPDQNWIEPIISMHHWLYLTFRGIFLQNRGWSLKFATGINVIIGIYQKIYEWPDYSITKMMYVLLGGSFWQKDSLVTLILFELCLLWYLAQSQILVTTL